MCCVLRVSPFREGHTPTRHKPVRASRSGGGAVGGGGGASGPGRDGEAGSLVKIIEMAIDAYIQRR